MTMPVFRNLPRSVVLTVVLCMGAGFSQPASDAAAFLDSAYNAAINAGTGAGHVGSAASSAPAPALTDTGSRAADSAGNKSSGKTAGDSSVQAAPSAAAPYAAAVGDTAEKRFDLAPFWGGGAGWSLGSMGLFSSWQQGLPDSLGDLSVVPSGILVDTTTPVPQYRTVTHTLLLKEKPSIYSIYFPVSCAFAVAAHENYHVTLGSSALYMDKRFVGAIRMDTLHEMLNIKETMHFAAVSIDASLNIAIPKRYFAITGVDMTFLSLGAGAFPLAWIGVRNGITLPDTFTAAFGDLKSDIAPHLRSLDAFGAGATWRIGVCTIRTLDPTDGLMVGLYYAGQWLGRFESRGRRLMDSDLNGKAGSATHPVSCVNHRMEVRFLLLKSLRSKKAANDTHEAD